MSAERYDTVPASLPATLPAVNRAQLMRVRDAIVARFFEPNGYRLRYGWDRTHGNVWLSPVPTRSGNHRKGLGRLIHDISHALFEETYPTRRPHDPLHAKYETDVAAFVAERIPRWFREPKPRALPSKPTKPELQAKRLREIDAGLKRWATKAKRAANAIRKLERERKRIVRALSPVTIN